MCAIVGCGAPPACAQELGALHSSRIDQAAAKELVDLPLPNGDHLPALYEAPSSVQGVLVMLPGGTGRVDLTADGEPGRGDNVLVRTRSLWEAQGYAVLIPDAPAGANLRGTRQSPAYAAIVEALVSLARDRGHAPVFLVGTSQGSVAAVNGAAHARPGQVAGLILTESVSRLGGSHETVFDADPQDVRVPTLVVANRDDRCPIAPPDDAPRIAAALTHAPTVDIVMVTGDADQSPKPCGSLTPHGYFKIEAVVVGDIVRWLNQHKG